MSFRAYSGQVEGTIRSITGLVNASQYRFPTIVFYNSERLKVNSSQLHVIHISAKIQEIVEHSKAVPEVSDLAKRAGRTERRVGAKLGSLIRYYPYHALGLYS